MKTQKYRLVVEGPPNWTSFREFWKMFYDEGAVVVASSYTKVGGLYDRGFRHDPEHPLESLADYCLGVYTNNNLPQRVALLEQYMDEYEADGLLINSIKSCNSFSAGQLMIMREIEKRTGKPARVHRDRSRGSPLLLRREREEPAGELLPDDRPEAAERRLRGVRGGPT